VRRAGSGLPRRPLRGPRFEPAATFCGPDRAHGIWMRGPLSCRHRGHRGVGERRSRLDR